MRGSLTLVAWLVAAVMSLCTIGCGPEPAPPMRVGTDVWTGNEMLALADYARRLDPAKVRRVEFPSNQEVLRALRNGAIDAGALLLDEALVAQHDGPDMAIVAAVDVSRGAHVILARPQMKGIADLKGHRIGVQVNSGGLQILRRALASANLSVDDITAVNVPPDRHASSFAALDVDAVVTYQPMATQVAQAGGVAIYDSSAIPNDVVNVLVVQRAYLAAHSDQVRALIDGWWSGGRVFRESPEGRRWSAARQGLTEPEFAMAFTAIELLDDAGSRAQVAGEAPPLLSTADRFHGYMRSNGRLGRDIDVVGMFRIPGWSP